MNKCAVDNYFLSFLNFPVIKTLSVTGLPTVVHFVKSGAQN